MKLRKTEKSVGLPHGWNIIWTTSVVAMIGPVVNSTEKLKTTLMPMKLIFPAINIRSMRRSKDSGFVSLLQGFRARRSTELRLPFPTVTKKVGIRKLHKELW